uniref:Uncharacterized protein n=1 Tax=Peronospora matthiolae TaxID=2874970 RepID=A0AAV1UXB1_9STRA
MRTHPTYYVRSLHTYYQYEPVSRGEEHLHDQGPSSPSSGPVSTSQSFQSAKRPSNAAERCPDELQPARHEENDPTFVLKLRERKHGTIVRTIVRKEIEIILYKVMELITPSPFMIQFIT